MIISRRFTPSRCASEGRGTGRADPFPLDGADIPSLRTASGGPAAPSGWPGRFSDKRPRHAGNVGDATLRRRAALCVFVFALALLPGGCSRPVETDRDNRRMVDAILTAVTMRNTGWLEDASARLEERHQEGELADWEHERLLAIVEAARSGEWQAAERMGYEFREERPFVRDGE